MTFANVASEVKLREAFHIHVGFVQTSRGDDARSEFVYGQDMLTFINEQFKPEFIHILGTSASGADDN